MKKKVLFSKVDMDTCLTGFLLGVTEDDEVISIQGKAKEEYLLAPEVICIEVGGSGKVNYNCFDHHQEGGPQEPACKQALEFLKEKGFNPSQNLEKLVKYVSIIDVDPTKLKEKKIFPNLSSVFSGMLLCVSDPKEQFFKGMEIFKKVVEEKIDPFSKIPELSCWRKFIERKKKENERLLKLKGKIRIFKSKSGIKIGSLKTSIFGAVGLIYGSGCRIAVVYNPCYGASKIRKFTIAGDNFEVGKLLPFLNKREEGWGGSSSGTIIGSPKKGSHLTLREVKEIVKENL